MRYSGGDDGKFVFAGQAEMNPIYRFGINIGVFWSELAI